MTVIELRERLANCPDDAEVVVRPSNSASWQLGDDVEEVFKIFNSKSNRTEKVVLQIGWQ